MVLGDVMWVPKNHEKVPRDHLWPKDWAKNEPKSHKNALNSSIFLKIQSHFWAISSHFKGYQTAFEVLRMAGGIPLVPKNHENKISDHYK